jgi:exopolysaccharide biosynthesis polyprenyl glycosylphosphotransferase
MSSVERAGPRGAAGASVPDRTSLVEGSLFYEEITAALDDRTLQILERRRMTARIRRRGWLVRRSLMWGDLLGLSLAFGLSELLFTAGGRSHLSQVGTSMEFLLFFATLPLWLVVAKLYGLYDRDESRANHTTADDIVGVFHLVTIGAWLLLAAVWATHLVSPAFTKVLTFWALAVPLVTLSRAGARAVCRRQLSYLQNTIVVGAGDVGQLVARKILQHPEYGINLAGFVDDRPKERRPGLEHLALLGSLERLPAIVRGLDIERVIVAFSNDPFERTIELVRSLKDFEVQIDIVPRLFDLVSPSAEIHTLEGIPLLGMPPLHLSRSSRLLKRAMDVTLAGAGLVLLAPVFVLIACLIKLDTPGPVFFRQIRMGSGGKVFRIFKFRTMVADAEERKAQLGGLNKHARPGSDPRMFKIPDDPRTTRVGRFFRRLSIDELPQLINVLKGEMSLVGPRPLILDEDRHVGDWARRRLDLRPGMTGLWQVLGRSDIPFDEMVKLDYLYVTTWSLWQDFRLLFRTIPLVVTGQRGSY